ncbi:unnamed protein product, partial [Meganyctiphanes norvegica]
MTRGGRLGTVSLDVMGKPGIMKRFFVEHHDYSQFLNHFWPLSKSNGREWWFKNTTFSPTYCKSNRSEMNKRLGPNVDKIHARPCFVEHKHIFIFPRDSLEHVPNGSGRPSSIWSPFVTQPKNKLSISYPQDFRQVAAIIDVDVVPDVCRRVRLLKHGSDKPLGFYIRDGTSVRVTPHGLERVPGIFISRLVPGGLAESTGLLAVNDEVLEVNGIEVNGKTLDQVTDMMVANSSNLIITVKPANQRTLSHTPRRGSFSRNSAMSSGSQQSHQSNASDDERYDADEIRDLTAPDTVTEVSHSHANKDEGVLHL